MGKFLGKFWTKFRPLTKQYFFLYLLTVRVSCQLAKNSSERKGQKSELMLFA